MEIKVPKMGEEKPKEEKKENKILTPEYVRELNRGLAYRLRQIEANHAIATNDPILTRKIIR